MRKRPKWRLFDGTSDVPDPYYGGDDGFARVREQVRVAAESWLDTDF